MGVSQNFYGPLAAWLAREGYLAATFDYVGIGRSRVSDLARLDVNILDGLFPRQATALFAGATFAFASSLYNLYIERSKAAGVFALVLLSFALFACPYW